MSELPIDISWNVILPILIISLALTVFALVDCIRTQQTNGPKWMWILIILLSNPLGPVFYFVIGRRQ